MKQQKKPHSIQYQRTTSFRRLVKRIIRPGSIGRRFYYRLRTRFGWPTRTFGERPPLPIDEDLRAFLHKIHQTNQKRVVLILATTELLESEGQRSTNLAFELSRREVPCIFGYWRWDHGVWCPQDHLEDGIIQIPVDILLTWPEIVFREVDLEERIVLFEFPHPGFFNVLAEAHASGWIAIYDVIDDWQEFYKVGQAMWYDPQFETHLLAQADAVTAIKSNLATRLAPAVSDEITVIPNGLVPGIDEVDQQRILERGEVTVGYFGYLAGAWLDWKLIKDAARRQSGWRFYLIGYGGEPEGLSLPPNVHLLGKKPRSELASFAANWDVAIIPFKEGRLAAEADPIKTYEYLAMGLPVVVTGVYPPDGGEGFVRRVEGVDAFIDALRVAADERGNQVDKRRAFAYSCTWSDRVDALLQLLERGDGRIREKRALFERR
ncbi:MAG: glycosyltransferase [Anaerolineales bacterium]|nr:glycosyltransferase [Anaerolineales bacterium]